MHQMMEMKMSNKLKDVIEALDGNGAVLTDDDQIVEGLNRELGLNIHSDIVITRHEINILKNAVMALRPFAEADADEYLENLADEAIGILDD